MFKALKKEALIPFLCIINCSSITARCFDNYWKVKLLEQLIRITRNSTGKYEMTLLALGTSSCSAFILSAILSLRNCPHFIFTPKNRKNIKITVTDQKPTNHDDGKLF